MQLRVPARSQYEQIQPPSLPTTLQSPPALYAHVNHYCWLINVHVIKPVIAVSNFKQNTRHLIAWIACWRGRRGRNGAEIDKQNCILHVSFHAIFHGSGGAGWRLVRTGTSKYLMNVNGFITCRAWSKRIFCLVATLHYLLVCRWKCLVGFLENCLKHKASYFDIIQ